MYSLKVFFLYTVLQFYHFYLRIFPGLVVAFILSLSSYPFLACLIAFFLSGSQATKFRAEQKKKFEENFKPGIALIHCIIFSRNDYTRKILYILLPRRKPQLDSGFM